MKEFKDEPDVSFIDVAYVA